MDRPAEAVPSFDRRIWRGHRVDRGLGGIAFLQLRQVNAAANDLQTRWMPAVRAALEWRSDLQTIRLATLQHAMAANERERRRHGNAVAAATEQYQKHEAEFLALVTLEEQRRLLGEIRTLNEAFVGVTEQVLEVSRQEATVAATALQNAEARPRA